MSKVKGIIDRFDSAYEVARALNLRNTTQVAQMIKRDSIPAWHWVRLVEAGKERGIVITFEELARMHARPTLTTARPIQLAH
ncbi:hypothetical protein IPV08_21780 [Methylobacterium sp. SD274]|uniref:carph-isopro domain-containing protein n=1 Tax=Methylobacterium sp. SD274 TaxID=2782009 RepID=UPI001A95DDCE|nr:hypothetical protein [Methylobacterium sp. SD274]MBO1022597.1 hypothetical protein [Methylobacterium sp. SD274]